MFAKNQLNRTTRRILMAYFVLLLALLIGLVEVALLFLSGDDPMTAVSIPWKLLSFNLMMVLVFVARYLRPYLLTPLEPTTKPQPILDPIEIEKERINRWSKRGF